MTERLAPPAEPRDGAASRAAQVRALGRRVPDRDWQTLFRQLEAVLTELAQSPVVAEDPEAAGRFRDLAGARDAEELALLFDRFASCVSERMREIVAARVAAGEMSEADAAAALRDVGSGIHVRAPVESAPAPAGESEDAPRPARRRTVLRL